MNEKQVKALRQKAYVLASDNKVGYAPIPHDLYRKTLPEMTAKYDGRTARDCIALYGYLHAHVNGESTKDTYMWAYPTIDAIEADLGIKRSRIKKLADILTAEGLLLTEKRPWYGHTKKMYMPLYLPECP
jgi:murein endopeptidase